MLKKYADRLDPQLMIVGTFSFVMLLSLICSLSVQPGHAGSMIAESAQQIEPLQLRQLAPAIVSPDRRK
jgi:hypothetical protein